MISKWLLQNIYNFDTIEKILQKTSSGCRTLIGNY